MDGHGIFHSRPAGGQKETVLIVDDAPMLRQMVREHLERHGLQIEEAESGQEALEFAHRVNPDLILLDIMMPDLNGLQVCQALREHEATRAIPVVLLTSHDGLEDRIRGLDAGANDYLTKPVQPGELLARVKAHLRTRELWEGLEQQQKDLAQLLELSKAVASTLRPSEIFHLIVERTAQLVSALRCSLVIVGEQEKGYVVASQDNPRITRLPITLERYPEIQEAIRRQQPVVVEDVSQDPLMAGVWEVMVPLEFRTLLVVPINLRAKVVGTLVLRMARSTSPFDTREVQLCQLIGEVAAIALQNAHLFESLEHANLNLEQLTLIDEADAWDWEVYRDARCALRADVHGVQPSLPLPKAGGGSGTLQVVWAATLLHHARCGRLQGSQRSLRTCPRGRDPERAGKRDPSRDPAGGCARAVWRRGVRAPPPSDRGGGSLDRGGTYPAEDPRAFVSRD